MRRHPNRIAVVLSFLLASGTASAASLPAPLEAVIKDVEARKAAAAELRFTFQSHTVTSKNEFRLRYDPRATEAWTLLPPVSEEGERIKEQIAKRAEKQEEGPDRELLAGDLREYIGDGVELIESSAAQRVYRFNLSETAKIGEGNFEAAKHLTGELAIGPDDDLRWVRFFAEKAFKPALVAKISTFDLKLYYDPIWNDGPYVIVRQAMEIDGSAFFRSFSESVKTSYSGFEKR